MLAEKNTFSFLVKEKFDRLSASQKKVAEYLLENLDRAAFSTAVQIAREVNVSETTVIRLSYALGFGGFSEMLEQIRDQVLQNNTAGTIEVEDSGTPLSQMDDPLAKVAEKEISMIRQSLSQLNMQDIWAAVDALIKADKVLVVGYRASYAVAYWFNFMLGMMRDNVYLCPSAGETSEKAVGLTDKSIVFAIFFPRYSKETLQLAEYAKSQGAGLISATDRFLSPIGRISDITFSTGINTDSSTGTASMAAVMSMLNTIFVGIQMKDPERVLARQESVEQFYTNYSPFIE
ncbi:MurR/RpiR family transcriptional regulator [Paenibacillus senegalensis]|uniref:MurR/RpiR family transcriptional regulator n=1 Tax=Paenibacillus senegalensis TaxID=1465766 RepID=UPI00028A04B5|nr:MurR/RpiR family transcriptional regulator [Paenibacillus senegalensis]